MSGDRYRGERSAAGENLSGEELAAGESPYGGGKKQRLVSPLFFDHRF
ncbi:hypothetical protein U8335_13470 [Roseiconus lacunae]|uniref:Uncharacterized protein n=1 Tax=Roseiconus lacunae TaxID=2605694 RepID=A0ABT7PCI8_9BACT|nr:hypothetical protein [Roseiconus lacunae]MDM4014205.1 hypothetical protein [Roseiconus lacunae]WRQ53500.1 hypothetical protein U8335_13470 [Stieleria sp. HD01]